MTTTRHYSDERVQTKPCDVVMVRSGECRPAPESDQHPTDCKCNGRRFIAWRECAPDYLCTQAEPFVGNDGQYYERCTCNGTGRIDVNTEPEIEVKRLATGKYLWRVGSEEWHGVEGPKGAAVAAAREAMK